MNLGKEWLNGYNPEQLQDEFLRAIRIPWISGLYHANIKTGLVIITRPQIGSMPESLVIRDYYTVFPQGENLRFALGGELIIELGRRTQDYIPTVLSLYGEGGNLNNIRKGVVIPKSRIRITIPNPEKEICVPNTHLLEYADVGKKRELTALYSQSGELLSLAINGTDAPSGEYNLSDTFSRYYPNEIDRNGRPIIMVYNGAGLRIGHFERDALYQFQARGNTLVTRILTKPAQTVTIPLQITPSEWLSLLKGYLDPRLTADPLIKDTQLDSWMRLSSNKILDDTGVQWTSDL